MKTIQDHHPIQSSEIERNAMKRIFTQVNFNTLSTNFRSAAGLLGFRPAYRLAAMLGLLVSTAVYAQVPTTIVLSVSNASPTYVTPNSGGGGTTLNPVIVTAAVTVTATGQPVTGGSVTFYDNVGTANAIGPDVIGTGSIQYFVPGTTGPSGVIPGNATLAFAFGPGPHSLTATYSGTTGGGPTAIFPATPIFAPSTTAAPTSLNSNGIAFSNYGFAVTGPGSFGELGYLNLEYSATPVDYSYSVNPTGGNSFIAGYGMQIPTGTSTLTDTTTLLTYPLTENTTFSQNNLLYQPVFPTEISGGYVYGNVLNEIDADQVTSFTLSDMYQAGVPAVVSVSTPQNLVVISPLYGNNIWASFAVAPSPTQAVTADLNGDGWPDMVVAHNDTTGTGVSIGVVLQPFLPAPNTVGPLSAPEKIYQLGRPVGNVATGDLNGDGFPDIVAVTSDGSNLIYVLLNDGEGNFTSTGVSFPAGNGASQVALGDFNQDGILDIAVLNTADATIGILFGNGDGTFQPMTAYGVGTAPTAFSMADLNVDGFLDFAITNNDSPTQAEVSFLYGQPGGTFNYVSNLALNQIYWGGDYPETNPHPTAIQATDLNGDGYPDLFIGFNINQVTWAIYVPTIGQYVYQSQVLTDQPNGYNFRTVSAGVADVDGAGIKDFVMVTTVNNLFVCPTCPEPNPQENWYYMFRLNGTMSPQWSGPAEVNSPLGTHNFVSSWVPAAGSIYAPTTGAGPITLNVGTSSISVTPTIFNFGSVAPNGSVSQPFLVANTGATAVIPSQPDAVLGGANPGAFSIVSDGCSLQVLGGYGLPPGGTCTISVTFNPTASGNYSGSLIVMNSAANSPQSATLTGTGTGVTQTTPVINWPNPAPIQYGTPLTGLQLDASSTVAGIPAYTPSLGTVLQAGTHTLSVTYTPTDTTDYTTATATVTLVVTQAPLTVTANNAAMVYGGSLPSFSDSITGYVNGDTALTAFTGAASLSTTATSASAPGTYPINASIGTLASNNYTFTFSSGTLSIGQATPVITWHAPAAIRYGKVLTATQLDATSPVAGIYAYTPALNALLLPGTYTLSVTLTPTSPDYAPATATVTLAVNEATLRVKAQNASITLGGTLPVLTYRITGFVNGDTQTTAVTGTPVLTTTATSTSPVGSYPIDVAIGTLAAANYVIDLKDGTLKIKDATLILATPDVTITYGSPIPTLTYTLSGFVNGDTQATASTGAPTVSTTATATSTVGSYPITVSIGTLVAPGYSILVKSGKLTITKATPLLNWVIPPPASVPFGTALSATQLDATASVPGAPFAYTPAAAAVLDAGSHTLNATFTPMDTADYTTAKISVTLTVTQASQTINFAPLASPVSYGIAAIPLVATASSGLPVRFSVVSGPGTITGSSLKITGPGTVVVAANQAGNADYSAAPQVTQTIVVYQGSDSIVLTVIATSRKSGQPFTFTATVTGSGVKPTGTVEFFDGANQIGFANLTLGGGAAFADAALAVGTHSITASYEGDVNYPPVTSTALVVTVTP
jgi:hypothetical protein